MTGRPTDAALPFSDTERAAFYRAIMERRDVRSHFLPDPIPDDILERILTAAHHAPSVGYMQPWDFILVRDRTIREAIRRNFDQAHESEAHQIEDAKAALYRTLKLEGILDSPLNICVTCDRTRSGATGLGRTAAPSMDLYSTCLAVQNLWLAARVEGLGVGWVSILDHDAVAVTLGLPPTVEVVAYLCIGYVDEFLPNPELERSGWRERLPLSQLVHDDRWGTRADRIE